MQNDPGQVYVLTSPWDRPPLSANQRLHWRKKAAITHNIRYWAGVAAQEAGIPPLGRCRVELIWQVCDRRRRDAENPVPTLKAVCDGLVDALVVADDVPDLMEKRMPAITYAPRSAGAVPSVVIIVTPLEATA